MNNYFLLVVAICTLLTGVYAIRFVYEVLKAAWCAARGKDIKWTVFDIFLKTDEWKMILIWGFIICTGIYGFTKCNIDRVRAEYEQTMILCDDCQAETPDIYILVSADDDHLCPYCYRETLTKGPIYRCPICKELYSENRSRYFGYCKDCGDEWIVACSFCGEDTLICDEDFSLCIRCIRIISFDEENRAVIRNLYDEA